MLNYLCWVGEHHSGSYQVSYHDICWAFWSSISSRCWFVWLVVILHVWPFKPGYRSFSIYILMADHFFGGSSSISMINLLAEWQVVGLQLLDSWIMAFPGEVAFPSDPIRGFNGQSRAWYTTIEVDPGHQRLNHWCCWLPILLFIDDELFGLFMTNHCWWQLFLEFPGTVITSHISIFAPKYHSATVMKWSNIRLHLIIFMLIVCSYHHQTSKHDTAIHTLAIFGC